MNPNNNIQVCIIDNQLVVIPSSLFLIAPRALVDISVVSASTIHSLSFIGTAEVKTIEP